MTSSRLKRFISIILALLFCFIVGVSTVGCLDINMNMTPDSSQGGGGETGGGGDETPGGGDENPGGGEGENPGGGDIGGGDIEIPDTNWDERGLTPQQYSFANLTGDDKYDRTVQIVDPTQSSGIYVGVFYSLWLGTHMKENPGQRIYDVNALEKLGASSPLYQLDHIDSPNGRFHFFSEPLYGYYSMNDPWVVTRHIELLTLSGIDYLLIDNTNAVAYPAARKVLMDTLLKYYQQGWDVPKVAFYTNSNSKTTIETHLLPFYKSNTQYNDLWFRFAGNEKPVIVGVTSDNGGATDQTNSAEYVSKSSEAYTYFNFYESQWPNRNRNEDRGMPWMGTWDEKPKPNSNGNASVSVIKHCWESVFSSNMLPVMSRGYMGTEYGDGAQKNSDWKKGDNIEWQLNAIRNNYVGKTTGGRTLKNLVITGWNEWMAIKNPDAATQAGSPNFHGTFENFVDGYNAEYSRDLEMGKEYGDGFYMQLLRHAREIKYQPSKLMYEMELAPANFQLSNLTYWDVVFTEYADFVGDAMARDGEDAANKPSQYIDNSNRNDIASIKVVYDSTNVYIMVETASNITAHNGTDTGWMNLMISTGKNANSFMGFDYIINRKPQSNGKTSVEKCNAANSYSWGDAGEAEYYVSGNRIAYKIPLSVLGLTSTSVSFTFKVTDNVTNPSDEMSYYMYGDCAPIGRNGYAYNMKSAGTW